MVITPKITIPSARSIACAQSTYATDFKPPEATYITTTVDNKIIPIFVDTIPSVNTLNNAPDARSWIPKYGTEKRKATKTKQKTG